MYNVPSPVTASSVSFESAVSVTVGVTVSKHSKRITFCQKSTVCASAYRLFFYACWGNPKPLFGLPPKPARTKTKAQPRKKSKSKGAKR
jgi:hypothetical protein